MSSTLACGGLVDRNLPAASFRGLGGKSLWLLALFLLLAACGPPPPTRGLGVPQVPVKKVGETVDLGDRKLTVTTMKLEDGSLTATVSLENTGSQPLEATVYHFEARDAEGRRGGTVGFIYGRELKGTVAPGTKAVGEVQFQFSGKPKGVRLYYKKGEGFPLEVAFEEE